MGKPMVVVVVARGEAPPPGLDDARDLAELKVVDDPDEATAALADADAAFIWDFRTRLLVDAGPAAKAVRWVHAGSIGVDAIVDAQLDDAAILTNTRGVFERPIAEYAMAMLLLFAKNLQRTLTLQADRQWLHRETRELTGGRMLVLGAGPVGREIARMARGLSMEVSITGRTARQASSRASSRTCAGSLRASRCCTSSIASTEAWADRPKIADRLIVDNPVA